MSLPGTYNPPSDRGPSQLISRIAGTNIGNFTTAGAGLAAAFDGTTNQGAGACAGRGNAAANSGYIGKLFAAPTALDFIRIYGSNDNGYIASFNISLTATAYGKNGGAEANETDGTANGALTFTDTANESAGRVIDCTDKFTMFGRAWVRFAQANNAVLYVAEVEFYGWQ